MDCFRERRVRGSCFLSLWRASVRHGNCADFQRLRAQKLWEMADQEPSDLHTLAALVAGRGVYKPFISTGFHGRVAHKYLITSSVTALFAG
jgi:hypothetical protein